MMSFGRLLFIGLRENQTNYTGKEGGEYGKEIFPGADMLHGLNNSYIYTAWSGLKENHYTSKW
jgi:hypothetical protein